MGGADFVASLTSDLRADADKLAAGNPVSPDIERKTIGRIGILVCEISTHLWTKEELAEEAEAAAKKVTGMLISQHKLLCKKEFAEKIEDRAEAATERPLGFGKCSFIFGLVDRNFTHLWWGFVLLSIVFGLREVLDFLLGGLKALGV